MSGSGYNKYVFPTRASAVDRGGGVSGGLMIWDQVNMCFVYVCAAEECAGVVAY
jgi:hypothetical protein